MANFLELNGYTVPVVQVGSKKPIITGMDSGLTLSGDPVQDRRYVRSEYEFETIPLSDRDAEGLIGLILGRGHSFRFDDSLSSGKGLAPHGTPVGSLVYGKDARDDAKMVYLESTGELAAKFWARGALEMAAASTNELSSDSATCDNAPTGFVARNGATLAGETTIKIGDSKSLKVTTSTTSGSGYYTDNVAGSVGSKTYTASAYVYTTEALPLTLFITDSGGGSNMSYTSTPNVWEYVEFTRTTTPGATWVRCGQGHSSTTSGKVFYIGRVQLEEKPAATPWVNGSRAAPSLHYKGITNLSDNLSFFAWVRPPSANPAGTTTLFAALDGNGNQVDFRRNGSTNEIRLRVQLEGVAGIGSYTYDSSPWDDGWHHVGFTMAGRTNGGKRVRLFYDGADVAGSVVGFPEKYPMLRGKVNDCYIGNNAGSEIWPGPIQDALVLPYAVGENYAAGLAARTRLLPHLPNIDAQGGFAPSVYNAIWHRNNEVKGRLVRATYAGMVDDGAYRSYLRRVRFTLQTVGEVG